MGARSQTSGRNTGQAGRLRSRVALAVGIVFVSVAVSVAGVIPSGDPAGAGAPAFRPDLVTRGFDQIQLCREPRDVISREDACRDGGGQIRTVLRITNQVANKGRGPLELAPRAGNGGDCNDNGNPNDDVLVDQVMYLDGNGNGRFDRGADNERRRARAGCRYYHPAHDHYHLDGYAQFELRRERNGKLARRGKKVSFCISDTAPFDTGLPGAPSSRFYEISACEQQDSLNGTSVGWYDEYIWKLSGQEIDVTGLKAGKYCLISRVDPTRDITETNERNNVRKTKIRLNPGAAPAPGEEPRDIRPLRGRCKLGR
jgi:Lysyl oxidase